MVQHADTTVQRCLFCAVEQMAPGCHLELHAIGGAIFATVHGPDCPRPAHTDGCRDPQCAGGLSAQAMIG